MLKKVRERAADYIKIGFLSPIFQREIASDVRERWSDPDEGSDLAGVLSPVRINRRFAEKRFH